MMSICSVWLLKNVKTKLLINLGFGVDSFHEVCHSLYLENIQTLTTKGGYLGAFSLVNTMEEAKKFEECLIYCQPENSIVS
jgi:hypothetical protein